MQEQNSEKTVALAVKTGKMSAKVLKDCMKAFLASQKNKSPKVYKGKQSVKQLTASGAQLTNIEVTDQNIKAFYKTARKYGIDYALKKDITQEPPKYFVFFKAKDILAYLPFIEKIGYVANSTRTVYQGTISAGRLYDKIENYAYAKVMFVTHSSVIAFVLDKDDVEATEDGEITEAIVPKEVDDKSKKAKKGKQPIGFAG